jgi:hypothetical protein
MNCNIRKIPGLLVLATGLLVLSACAGAPAKPGTADIEQRAAERWEKLLSGDIAGAYEYLSPGFRSGVSSMQYQRAVLLHRVQWTGAKVKGAECGENTCDVKILLNFKVAGGLPGVRAYDGQQDVVESWILSDGTWYLVP